MHAGKYAILNVADRKWKVLQFIWIVDDLMSHAGSERLSLVPFSVSISFFRAASKIDTSWRDKLPTGLATWLPWPVKQCNWSALKVNCPASTITLQTARQRGKHNTNSRREKERAEEKNRAAKSKRRTTSNQLAVCANRNQSGRYKQIIHQVALTWNNKFHSRTLWLAFSVAKPQPQCHSALEVLG